MLTKHLLNCLVPLFSVHIWLAAEPQYCHGNNYQMSSDMCEQGRAVAYFILNMLITIISCNLDNLVKAKLLNMDMDQLKQFIEAKGNQRKKDLYNTCVFQTRDATKTAILRDSIDGLLAAARERQK